MKRYSNKKINRKKVKKGYGLIDYIVNKLPEIHIPGYQYCGPGTDLDKRLARGDPGINKLDQACKIHDIEYSKLKNSNERYNADKALVSKAWPRVYSKDAKLGERASALLVSGLIGAKMGLSKIGLGLKKRRSRRRKVKVSHRRKKVVKKNKTKKRTRVKRRKRKKKLKSKSITFSKLLHGVKDSIKQSESNASTMHSTINAAIRRAKDMKRSKNVKIPRVLKLPKFGGSVSSLLPILTTLSALGSISSSAVGVMKALKNVENVKKQNINGKTERKIGHSLYLHRNVKGSEFYLKPFHHGAKTSKK